VILGGVYARWIGWDAAASAALVLTGDLLEIVSDAAFLAVLDGFAIFLALLVALGISMWRRARSPSPIERVRAAAPSSAPPAGVHRVG